MSVRYNTIIKNICSQHLFWYAKAARSGYGKDTGDDHEKQYDPYENRRYKKREKDP